MAVNGVSDSCVMAVNGVSDSCVMAVSGIRATMRVCTQATPSPTPTSTAPATYPTLSDCGHLSWVKSVWLLALCQINVATCPGSNQSGYLP